MSNNDGDTKDLQGTARYTWGGDEFLFVEIDESMSLAANFKANSMASVLAARALPGISDVCPANASLLIRFDPDKLAPAGLEAEVRAIELEVDGSTNRTLETRIIEIPVWYDDPFTRETGARFRAGHQRPNGTDLDFAAEANHLTSAAEFIRRHHSNPWLVSMVGFVAGLPFMFQMVPRDQQLEVPKYLSPRTDTPALTVGHGGCFACIYSVRGAGGYQMFGVAAAPIFDPAQKLPDFKSFMIFFKPGDIVKFRPVDKTEYERIQEQVEDGTFVYRQASVTFNLAEALENPVRYNNEILERLNGI
ncbi:carboxyltransferase domain-containing protein [Paenarthrobacter sp. PH39-S1]|uniref:5-oxoprolinase subunit B family protein n=1 Tax=Paenarthrobacter sp. PH39-S1 TaxID=3046204 RepID=UPI0024BB6DA1|nr:carboxyltransferase domain-containing protein [Paenarthrobacter sp. PH39-S1]MDJ0356819.1 carboxyltransferase domain-containing protein [Paenarthrobacter sp. PH39-S1]